MTQQNKPILRFKNFSDDWEQRKLKSLVKRITRKNKNLESNLPLTISAQHGLVDQITFFNKQVASKDVSGYYLVKKGEFAYNKSYSSGYPWGAIKRLDNYDKGVLSTLYIVFKPIDIASDFLVSYYDTTFWYKEVSMRAAEGARNHGLLNISAQDFFETELVTPTQPEEQEKIGAFFKQLDDTLALHQRKLELLKEQKTGFLQKMFPKNGSNVPEIRFSGFTEDWEQRKLIDVAEMFDNLRIPVTASDRVEGNTAYYGANGIQDYVDGFTHDGEFVLIAEDGANDLINYPVNYVKGKIWVNNHAHVVSGKKSELDNLFLTARIKSMNISHWLVGGGRAKLNGDVLKKIPLTLPIYEEQKKIGAFFKQLDDAIALHQRKLEKTKALKSAYLSELFPVEGERKPKRRFAGFIDDWKQGTVGEYGYFYYGKSAPKWSVTKDAIIPCVRYGELYTKFGAKIDKVYSYTNISKENLKFSTGNEVLVPRVGEDPLDFANCSWLSIPNVAIGEMISVYNTEENPLFISYYFNSQLRHAFAKRVEGGNVSNLYFTYLENITISIPNKEEQDTIANFLESLDSVVEHHQHKLEKLKNIKQAYLNELFV